MRHMTTAMTAAIAIAVAMPVAAMVQRTADYSFTYTYPAAAARIPALRAWLDADRARLKATTAREAADDRRERAKSDFPFHPYETQKTWKVVTDTPRFLSLSADSYRFTGGAHGSPASASLVWDKAARRVVAPKSVFVSDAALWRAVRPAYCAALSMERRKRLSGDIESGYAPGCPALKELTILLGSTGHRAIDRIGFIADPYVAGAYAEGAYEVTLPVTAAVLMSVGPAYRSGFAVARR